MDLRQHQAILAGDLVYTVSHLFMPNSDILHRDPVTVDPWFSTSGVGGGDDMLIQRFRNHSTPHRCSATNSLYIPNIAVMP